MSNKFTVVNYKKQQSNIVSSYDEEFKLNLENSKKILKVIDRFVMNICRSFADNMIETVKNSHKYCILYTYNNDENVGKKVNDKFMDIDVEYILSNKWIQTVKQYKPDANLKTVERRIQEYITSPKFGNGIDPESKKKYIVSVFWYKKSTSMFKNGIIVSRDGIKYT